jgi:putative transposase
MGRSLRADDPGFVYPVLNRANARLPLFHQDGLLPNHGPLVLGPEQRGALARFVGRLTRTHTQRWHAHYHRAGSGHLYQGRYQSFPIQRTHGTAEAQALWGEKDGKGVATRIA